MDTIILDYEKRPYIVFAIIFGIVFFILILAKYSTNGYIDFDIGYLMPFVMYLVLFIILRINKVSYNKNKIKYRSYLGTKTINIKDIKRYKIKSTVEPFKPTVGFYIDTKQKKSAMIIPANLFTAESLNKLMEHINNVNGDAKGKANAGKSVFKY